MKICLPQWGDGSTPIRRIRRCVCNSRLLLLAACCLLSSSLLAQNTVQGTVVSGDSALSNVTVQVKGTRNSTRTDENGRFTISAPPNGSLLISYVGYASQEVVIGNR